MCSVLSSSSSQWSVRAILVQFVLWMPSTWTTRRFWWPPLHQTPQSDCGSAVMPKMVWEKKNLTLTVWICCVSFFAICLCSVVSFCACPILIWSNVYLWRLTTGCLFVSCEQVNQSVIWLFIKQFNLSFSFSFLSLFLRKRNKDLRKVEKIDKLILCSRILVCFLPQSTSHSPCHESFWVDMCC